MQLRPIERRVRHMLDDGLSHEEIAWRFRRSPGFVRRVTVLSGLQRKPRTGAAPHPLRPVERVVHKGLAQGLPTSEVASRLRRTPEWVERVDAFASHKLNQA